MRVLVVGATGFIGGHVARKFREAGHVVTALVRSRARAEADARLVGIEIVQGALADLPAAVEGRAFDVLVFAAGAWLPDERTKAEVLERRCREVFVDGMERAAELALSWNAHLVYVSGISKYGKVHRAEPIREESPPRSLCVYGMHVRFAEEILLRLARAGLRFTALCPPEVYGPGDPGSHLLFLARRIQSHRFVQLGDGGARWSLCHVDLLARAAVRLAGGPGAGRVLVADARPYSWKEIAAAVARALGKGETFVRVPRALALAAAALSETIPRPPGFPEPFARKHVELRTADIVLDTSRALGLGLDLNADLDEGLRAAVAQWRSEGRLR